MRIVFPLCLAGMLFIFPLKNSNALELGIPLACHYGTDCFIQNYYDTDPGKEARDYHLGHLSYDAHDGTDFRIRDYVAMQEGVDVIASAEGVVKAVRDEMDDVNVNKIGKDTVMSKGCGNTVVLLHPDNYSTFYCHMKKGSIRVKPKDVVVKGQKLGEVGLSGLTEFPHVHFGVLHNGIKIDPFTGNSANNFGHESHPLWDKDVEKKLAYIPTGVLNSAFARAIPEPEAAREGKFTLKQASSEIDTVVFWVDIFGLQPNDSLSLIMYNPDGTILAEKTLQIEHYKAAYFYYIGKKGTHWKKGTYLGKTIIRRNQKIYLEEMRSLKIS